MRRYIDAEKLKSEIKRLKDKYPSWQLKLAMDDLCDFITSLQQEQPEVDLEKEIRDWCNNAITGYEPIYTGNSLKYSMLPNCARHFFELGKNSK